MKNKIQKFVANTLPAKAQKAVKGGQSSVAILG